VRRDVTVLVDPFLQLEQEFKREEQHVLESIAKAQKGIERLESKFGRLEKKLTLAPGKTKAASWTNLMYSMFRVFTFAFISSFVPFVTGLGSGINNMDAAKAAAWAAAIAGSAAVLKFVQASVTKDEEPFLDMGIFDGKKK
jgi:hypothetical protein